MHTKSIVSLSIAALLLSIDVILTKVILNRGVTAVALTGAKVVLAGVLVFVFILLSEHKKHLRFPKRHLSDLALIGATIVFASIIGLIGLKSTTATNLAFLRVTPFVVAILSQFILRERLPRQFWTLLVMVSLGIFLLSSKGNLEPIAVGDALILLSSVFYGFASVWQKRTMENVKPLVVVLGRYLFGSLILLPLLFLFFAPEINSLYRAPGLILVTAVLTVTWVSLWATVVEREGASLASAFRISPVLVAILAFIFLGETLSFIQILGAALILFSSFRISRLKATYLPTGT